MPRLYQDFMNLTSLIVSAAFQVNTLRNIEVKISGLSGELSKEITDHLGSLYTAFQQLLGIVIFMSSSD